MDITVTTIDKAGDMKKQSISDHGVLNSREAVFMFWCRALTRLPEVPYFSMESDVGDITPEPFVYPLIGD